MQTTKLPSTYKDQYGGCYTVKLLDNGSNTQGGWAGTGSRAEEQQRWSM